MADNTPAPPTETTAPGASPTIPASQAGLAAYYQTLMNTPGRSMLPTPPSSDAMNAYLANLTNMVTTPTNYQANVPSSLQPLVAPTYNNTGDSTAANTQGSITGGTTTSTPTDAGNTAGTAGSGTTYGGGIYGSSGAGTVGGDTSIIPTEEPQPDEPDGPQPD